MHSKRCQARNRICCSIRDYFHWKYEADKNLVQCTACPWTILRPSGLVSEPDTGRLDIGRTHNSSDLCRERTLPMPLRSSSSGRTPRILR
ncbi:hypothetical protein BC834DRAFT_888176 [Gloeopeniophorella convolvens]|nr:hypothetical protein BC834DRAFT_888176 [Gloeopeniophorella convolvens]